MYKKLVILFGTMILCSCSGEKKEKVLDMSDLTPQAKRNTTKSQKEKDTTHSSLFNLSLADSCGMRIQEFTEEKDPMFPDRFMPKSKLKLNLHSKESSLFMGQWVYPDSLSTINAFFNWLDCFGPQCSAFKLGEESPMQKDGFICFINDTSITYVSAKEKLNLTHWQQYLEKQYQIEQWDMVIWQETRKEAIWMKYDVLPGKKKKQFLPLK